MQPSNRVRPSGVTVLAVLAAIGGVLGILGGLLAMGLTGAVAAGTGNGGLAGLVGILGILALVQGALALAFAYGAWTLKPWAWTLGIIAFGISLALNVLNIIDGGDISRQAVSIVIGIVILYYLFTPAVKQAFGRA